MKSKLLVLTYAGIACAACIYQDNSLSVVRVSASASGQLVFTADAGKIAVADSKAQNIEVISLPGTPADATYTFAEWSPSGKKLALTRADGAVSSIVIFWLDSKRTSVVPNTKTDMIACWVDEDNLLVLRASDFRGPRLLGPEYAEPTSYVLLNAKTGQVSPYEGEYNGMDYPKSISIRGDWKANTRDSSIRAFYRGKQKFITQGGKYSYGLSLSDASVYAMQDYDGMFKPRLVSVSLATGEENVLLETESIRRIFQRLK
jgi:hypothetical protein